MKKLFPLILTFFLLTSCESPSLDSKKEVIDIMMIGSASEDTLERINAKINEELVDYDFEVKISYTNNPSYDFKVSSLMLANSLPDLFVVKNRSILTTIIEEGVATNLSSYLDDLSFKTNISSSAEWSLVTYKEHPYAIPFNNKTEHRFAFAMNGEICEELGIDETKITNLEELYDVLLQVKEVYKDIPVVTSNYKSFGSIFLWESIEEDSSNHGMSALSLDGSTEIKLLTEVDEFKNFSALMRKWNKEGLIIEEPSFNKESRLELVNAKKAFGGFCSYSYLLSSPDNIYKDKNTKYAFIGDWRLDNLDSNNMFVLSSKSTKKEKALKALEEIYFNNEICKTLLYGIEGVDYTVDDKGELVQLANSSRYGTSAWCIPNNRRILRDLDEKENVYVLPSYGFWCDYSDFKKENVLCKSVMDKYFDAIVSGQIDTEAGISRCHEELIESGARRLLEEEQRQFDLFLSK